MSSIPLALIQALTRRPRANAPSVDVTLPDGGGFTDAATVERNLGRVGSQPFVPDAAVRSPRIQPAFPDEDEAPVRDMAFREGRDTSGAMPMDDSGGGFSLDSALQRATRPRVAALPEGTVTNLPDNDALTRSAPPAANDLQGGNLAFRPEMERSTIDIGEGLRSPDAARVRNAMELRRSVEADKPRGFWGKVGRTLKGIGEGAIQGAARGGGLGMLAGAVAGGVSPKYADKMSDELEFQRRLPENVQSENIRYRNEALERQKQAELRQQANFERQSRMTEAQIRNQETDNQYQRDRFGFDREKELALERERQTDNQRALDQNIFDRRDKVVRQGGGERVDMADLFTPTKATPNRGQVVPVAKGEAYRLPSQAQEDARKLTQVTSESRARNAADFEEYMKMRPYVAADKEQSAETEARIKASYDKTADQLDLSGVPTLDKFEATKKSAEDLYGRAENARRTATSLPEGDDKAKATASANKLQIEADAAMGQLWAIHSHMLGSGGYEDNSGGGWAGLKRTPRTKKGGTGATVSGVVRSAGSAGKTPKDMTQEEFEYSVRTRFNNDVNAARAAAKKLGYSIGGQPIQ